MAPSLAPSTAVAVVFTTASLLALAGGLGVALRGRRTRQTVAKRGQLLARQLREQAGTIDTDVTLLEESRNDLGDHVREAQSTFANRGEKRFVDRPSLFQSADISETVTGALTAVRRIADSLDEVARQAKDLPVEVVLIASDSQEALVALVVATDALTNAATELEQTKRELARVTTDSFLQVATGERTLARLTAAASAVERALVSIYALRKSMRQQ